MPSPITEKLDLLQEKINTLLNHTNDTSQLGQKKELTELIAAITAKQTELAQQNQKLQQANEQLTKEKQYFQQVFYSAPVAQFVINKAHRIVACNKTAEKWLSSHKNKIHGSLFSQFIQAASQPQLAALQQALGQQKTAAPFVQLVLQNAKNLRLVQAQTTQILPELGGYLLILTDISQRQQQQQQLVEEHSRYKAFVQHAMDGYLITDETGCIVTCSGLAQQPLKAERQRSFIWDYYFELFPAKKQTDKVYISIKNKFQHFYRSGDFSVLDSELDLYLPGQLVVQHKIFSTQTAWGYRLSAILSDITHEKTQRTKQACLASIVENISDPCVFKNSELRILGANSAFLKSVGKTGIEEVAGKRLSEIIGVGDDTEPLRSFNHDELRTQTLALGQFIAREEIINAGKPNEQYLLTRMFPVFEKQQRIGLASITTDITEGKKHSIALAENEKRYRKVLQHMPMGLAMISATPGMATDEYRIISANPAFEHILSLASNTSNGQPLLQVVPQATASWKEKLTEINATIGFNTFREYYSTINKCLEWWVYRGAAGLLVLQVQDVTKQHKYQQNQAKVNLQLASVFDHASTILFLLNKNGGVIRSNLAKFSARKTALAELGDLLHCAVTVNKKETCGLQDACQDCELSELIKETQRTKKNILRKEVNFHQHNTLVQERVLLVSTTYLNLTDDENILVSVEDITQDKRIEEALLENEERYRIFSELAREAIVIHHRGFVLETNSAYTALTGNTYEEVIGERFLSKTFPEKYHAAIRKSIKLDDSQPIELECFASDGTKLPVELSSYRFTFRGRQAQVSAIRDVRDQKEMQQRIAHAIIKTEERDKSLFARELHDGIGPLLSTSKIYIKAASVSNNPERRKTALLKLEETVNEALMSIREISNRLSPHILENFGLVTAVQAFCTKVDGVHPVKFSLQFNENKRFDKDAELTLYRVIVELINNSLKYANAELIRINIRITKGELFIDYSDNGTGFDVKRKMKDGKGMGLFNILSRIKLLNGFVEFNSQAAQGMLVKISLPIDTVGL